jgi:hypothetical protein
MKKKHKKHHKHKKSKKKKWKNTDDLQNLTKNILNFARRVKKSEEQSVEKSLSKNKLKTKLNKREIKQVHIKTRKKRTNVTRTGSINRPRWRSQSH